METQEEENITQDDRKTENETQECEFKIHVLDRNEEKHEQNKEDTEIENEKNAEPENNEVAEIEKKEEIMMIELQSEDENKAEAVRKADNNQ